MDISKLKLIGNLYPGILVLIIFLYSCDRFPHAGTRQISETIEESKAKGVFIAEYRHPLNSYPINDSLSVSCKRAWIEKYWYYNKLYQFTSIDSSLMFYVELDFSNDINTSIDNLEFDFIDNKYSGSRTYKNTAHFWCEINFIQDTIKTVLLNDQEWTFIKK